MISNGYNSRIFRRTGDANPQRIGFLDLDSGGDVRYDHYAFADASSGAARVIQTYDCQATCAPVRGGWSQVHSHGIWTVGAAMGWIMDGQDPNNTLPPGWRSWHAPRARRWHAPRVLGLVYLARDCSGAVVLSNRRSLMASP